MLETLLENVSWTFEYVTVYEDRNEFEIGGPWSIRLGIISYLCSPVLTSLSKLLKYEQLENGLLLYLLLQKNVKISETCYFMQRMGASAPQHSLF